MGRGRTFLFRFDEMGFPDWIELNFLGDVTVGKVMEMEIEMCLATMTFFLPYFLYFR